MSAWAAFVARDFLGEEDENVVGQLAKSAADARLQTTPAALQAWRETIRVIKQALELAAVERDVAQWGVLLEYEIPRRALRPDVVLLAGDSVVVVEFKAGSERFDRAALMQVTEYAQDLRDFHRESVGHAMHPVLVATAAGGPPVTATVEGSEIAVQCINGAAPLAELLIRASQPGAPQIDVAMWDQSGYQPTHDILSAAREVFAHHNIREIGFAYADNLDRTVDAVRASIRRAMEQSERVVVFVTGVPGSGKTLAGLSAVHNITNDGDDAEPLGAYLSGNRPLIQVLQYALAKDFSARTKAIEMRAKRLATTFVQPVDLYIQNNSDPSTIPPDHVVVFDEAQRAWDAEKVRQEYAKKPRQDKQIGRSQAAIILDALQRVEGWAVLVALVGEGQEINRGEGGLAEWVRALEGRPLWKVLAAPEMLGELATLAERVEAEEKLHLTVSVRSPRARSIADWAAALVEGDFERAATTMAEHREFPILLTRSLEDMRAYLRDRATTDRRIGLLASSQARRLRAFGLEMSTAFQKEVKWPQWFVEDATDIRSSFSLEVAASEFKCQGLEIDWAGLCWGDDFLWDPVSKDWLARRLSGNAWEKVTDLTHSRNRYRVLLTRARYGLVIWVPQPRSHELLIDGEALDRTAQALLAGGAQLLIPSGG